MNGTCKLCGLQKVLQYSHIIPAFAVRWLKETSATGYLKGFASEKRLQETKRVYLLCVYCEAILARDEKAFCEQIFIPYHERKKQSFEYGSWLRRFLVGLHWKVLVTREDKYPDHAEAAYAQAEAEWRQFLLGQSSSPGKAELHLFLLDVVQDASGPLPKKINVYFARGFDLTPIFSDAGMAGVYAKIIKAMTVSFLTPRNVEEQWDGTQVGEEGILKTPQTIKTNLGHFLDERARLIEQMPKTLTVRQRKKLLERAKKEPAQVLESESFRAIEADIELRERMARRQMRSKMKGRDRNLPCPCGSGRKYKKCCGQI